MMWAGGWSHLSKCTHNTTLCDHSGLEKLPGTKVAHACILQKYYELGFLGEKFHGVNTGYPLERIFLQKGMVCVCVCVCMCVCARGFPCWGHPGDRSPAGRRDVMCCVCACVHDTGRQRVSVRLTGPFCWSEGLGSDRLSLKWTEKLWSPTNPRLQAWLSLFDLPLLGLCVQSHLCRSLLRAPGNKVLCTAQKKMWNGAPVKAHTHTHVCRWESTLSSVI